MTLRIRAAAAVAAALSAIAIAAPSAQAGTWDDLPPEVKKACLSELPQRDLAEMARVNKQFHAWIGVVAQPGVRKISSQAELDALFARPPASRHFSALHLVGTSYTTFRLPAGFGGKIYAFDPVRVIAEGERMDEDGKDRDMPRSRDISIYGKATVTASGTGIINVYGEVEVTATDRVTVRPYGQSRVFAYDNTHIAAYDSAQVFATDKAFVVAYGNAQVRKSGKVEAHRYGQCAGSKLELSCTIQ